MSMLKSKTINLIFFKFEKHNLDELVVQQNCKLFKTLGRSLKYGPFQSYNPFLSIYLP